MNENKVPIKAPINNPENETPEIKAQQIKRSKKLGQMFGELPPVDLINVSSISSRLYNNVS